MKTNIISKWAALLLTLSGMAAMPLTVSAAAGDNLLINTATTVTESGKSYLSNGTTNAAVQVSGSGVYHGTNINATGTAVATGAGRYGVYVFGQGSVSIFGGTVSTLGSGTNQHGVMVNNASFAGNDLVVSIGDSYAGYGLYATGGVITGSHVTITTLGHSGHGIQSIDNGLIDLTNVSVHTSGGSADGVRVYRDGSVRITGGEIVTNGANARGINLAGTGVSNAEVTNVNITTTGSGAYGISAGVGIGNNLKILVVSGGLIDAQNAHGIVLGSGPGAGTNPTENVDDLLLRSGTVELTLKDGAQVSGGKGGIYASNVLTGTDSSGQIAQVEVPLVIRINLEKESSISGDVTVKGSTDMTIDLSGNSSLTGDVTGSGSSTIDLTVTGPGSSFLGDVNQNDNSTITVTIDDGAYGKGGFNGGDLNVLGPDSVWDFDKDSHVNNGYNDGTLGIYDKDVIFDNLINNGKIIITINSDDQTHGTLDVTGSAGGNGNIVVNVTGSTAASQEDQDRIINDLVQGNGKGVWEFDPIEWGLIEEEVVVGPDGNLYVRNDGKLSTAGNIATGLIAAQKGSWFAQQNSLLKRMGELRLNAEHTTNLSGKDDDDKSVFVRVSP